MDRTTWLLILAAVAFITGVGLLFTGVDDEPTGAATTTSTRPDSTTSSTVATTSATIAEGSDPRFFDGRCEFDEPAGFDVECGWLIVPEDRSNPDNGETVQLHVAIFRTDAEDAPADPIVYLEGGPGGDALEAIPFTFSGAFAPFVEGRDFIMFDQRGTGYSTPSLDCTETTDLAYELLDSDITTEEALAAEYEALVACRRRLVEEADLTEYNSAASAADLADLRVALGYDEWNLFGISYGTRLALTVMRDQPEGIRSVILDSTYPPQVSLPLELGINADRAFSTFFDSCAGDDECSEAFPDLRTRFFALVDRLDAEPITISLLDVFTLDEHPALVNGDTLIGLLFQSLYSSELIPILPGLIEDAENADYQSLELLLSNFLANLEFISVGQTYAVQCHEEVPFTDPADLATAGSFDPYIERFVEAGTSTGPFVFEICDLWDAGSPDPVENEAVSSDIPTLVLAGQFDPITPPAWGRLATETLSNSYFFEFPGIGHGASVADDCPRSIALSFLDDPSSAPNAGCIEDMTGPDFITGNEPVAAVQLDTVTVEIFGTTIEALAPNGWDEVNPGVYLRGADGLDQTALLFQAIPGNQADLLLATLTAQLGADEGDITTTAYQAVTAAWDIHHLEIGGVSTDVALTETDGFTVLVLLASDPDERDRYFEEILLPILDVLQVR